MNEDVKQQQQAEIKKQEKEKELKQAESAVEETEKNKTAMEEERHKMGRIDKQINDLAEQHGQLDKQAIQN